MTARVKLDIDATRGSPRSASVTPSMRWAC